MIHDISPLISSRLSVWPGDTPPTREILMDLARGDSITLSTLRSTVHLGAHADAPSHYGNGAPSIEARDLSPYLGRCQVISVRSRRGDLVRESDLPAEIEASRVLIRTDSFPDFEHFNEDFAALDPALIESLANRGVRLIGVDTPSVDPFTSKTLPSHQALLKHDLAVLEGLVLKQIPDGFYELIALPLRLDGFDASPVRAVLRTLDDREES